MSWSSLPSQNFQNILKNLLYSDVNNLLLVCRSWFIECDYFLKDKTVLLINRIPNPEEVSRSQRRFECVHVNNSNELSTEIINCLTRRDVKYATKIVKAYIKYASYEDLHSILNSIGKELRILHLKNNVKSSSDLRFPTLELVEELKIECLDQSIETIAPFFSNLKVLDIQADYKRVTQSLIKVFLERNQKLERFYCNEIWVTFEGEPIFQGNKQLRILKTDNSELSTVAFKSSLPLEEFESDCGNFSDDDLRLLRQNFMHLETLFLFEDVREFTERGLSEIWTFPKLKTLRLMSFRLSNVFWKNSLFKSQNPELTSLSLIYVHLNDELMAMCTKSTPNVKKFEANKWDFTSFRSIQEMAENWKKLETLSCITLNDMSFECDRLKCPLVDTPVFENLKTFNLTSNFKQEILTLLKHLKAPNLKSGILEICFWNELQMFGEAVELFSERFVQVEVLEIRDLSTLEIKTMETVSRNLVNLRSLTLEGTTNLPVAVVGVILDSSRGVKNIKIIDFEEMFLESAAISLDHIYRSKNNSKVPGLREKRISAVEKMCKSRDPPINAQHMNTVSRLYIAGIDIILGKSERTFMNSDDEEYDEESERSSDYSIPFDTDSDDDDEDDAFFNHYVDSDDEEDPNAKRRRLM